MAERPNAVELERRNEAAALLLANGTPRTAAVTVLAERYGVNRRTARRYVAAGALLLAEEVGTTDLNAMLAESIERLRRLAYAAETAGNLSAAVGAEKAATGAVVALSRLDAMAIGHTLAVAESAAGSPETFRARKRFRRTIRDEPDLPF
ncbi:MAG: hypothetical protein RLZZ515_46 [Cyanobacteriota bacterium]|jgi:hypothetical protein